jgi:hypothetical protein
VLDGIGPALVPLPNPVTVEGHTDDLPISGRFATNWELSTERATTVLRYMMETHGLPAGRLSAAGYADQRPLVENTAQTRATNRRVEVIVRATAATAPDAAAQPRRRAPAPHPAQHQRHQRRRAHPGGRTDMAKTKKAAPAKDGEEVVEPAEGGRKRSS